ncbi:guanine nucleotide binding protein [Chytriomyces sp. MP71]|nr:guanine nucleotide binding protein [Chytriomyces sp. MP71]
MCQSPTNAGLDSPDTASVSKGIDKKIEEERKAAESVIKLLLLGAGETGKSTILKQMKLIYTSGFTEQDRKSARAAIILGICTSVKVLVNAMTELQIPYGFDASSPIPSDFEASHQQFLLSTSKIDEMNQSKASLRLQLQTAVAAYAAKCFQDSGGEHGQSGPAAQAALVVKNFDTILGFANYEIITDEAKDAILALWADPGVQYCLKRSNEFQIMETCSFFLSDICRFCEEDYLPTNQDMLNSRVMTTQITETIFSIDRIEYHVFDVAGQRSQRKRWAPYFDNVHAIIFVAAISSYDQTCYEDNFTNRITESLNLFASICNHPVFKSRPIILFLNKIDILKEKLPKVPVVNYFPDYQGDNDYETASSFFSQKFLAANKYTDKELYVHFTWATDTNQVRKVLVNVNETITRQELASFGFV